MEAIWDFIANLFTADFSTKFGCGGWWKELIWLHIVADLAIWIAYMTIPFLLLKIVRNRRDVPFNFTFFMFAMFIIGCGFTHFMAALVTHWPIYRFDFVVKAATAIVSLYTAYNLYKIYPIILGWPNPLQVAKDTANREARYTRTLENIHSAVVVADENMNIIFWYKNAQKLFGWTAEEMVGRNVLDIIPERYREAHMAGVRNWQKTGDAKIAMQAIELAGLHKDGHEFPIAIIIIIHTEDDGSRSVSAFIQDITVKKEFENIKFANQALRAINAELESFAYIASHDLQDPLRTMNAYLKFIDKKFPSPEAKEFVNVVLQSNKKMQELVANLLEYARQGSRETDFKPTNMRTIIDSVLKGMNESIVSSQAKIIINNMPSEVLVDEYLMGSVYQNLIQNSIKYADPNRKPVIELGFTDVGTSYEFYVKDNAIGISKEDMEKLFVLYRRVRKDEKGVGFGLAICRKAIERHAGKIWAESEVGVGSTFYFRIPKKRIEPYKHNK